MGFQGADSWISPAAAAIALVLDRGDTVFFTPVFWGWYWGVCGFFVSVGLGWVCGWTLFACIFKIELFLEFTV